VSQPPPAGSQYGGSAPAIVGTLRDLGLMPQPGLPPRVTRLFQALWAVVAAGVGYAVLSVLAMVTLPWYLRASGFLASAVFMLLLCTAVGTVAVMLVKGTFARMNLPDRRLVVFIVLAVMGLTTVTTLILTWGQVWYILMSVVVLIAQGVAIGFAIYLLFQSDVVGWINAQPGRTRHMPKPDWPESPPPGA
jgi:hypothetical protein